MLWVAAAATLAVGGGLAYSALRHPEPPRPEAPSPPAPAPAPSAAPAPPTAPPLVTADELRRRAKLAMDEGRPDDCLMYLDEARVQDPAGDTAPDVKALRSRADPGLKPKMP